MSGDDKWRANRKVEVAALLNEGAVRWAVANGNFNDDLYSVFPTDVVRKFVKGELRGFLRNTMVVVREGKVKVVKLAIGE